MEIRESVGELKAGTKKVVVGGSPAELVSTSFRWSLLPSVSISQEYLPVTKLPESYWKQQKSDCREASCVITIRWQSPKCHLWKPLSSMLLLQSLLVIVDKEDSRYPSCFSVSESITHWTYCSWTIPKSRAGYLQAFQQTVPTSTVLEGCRRLT